jgi:hypothetical protein
MEIAQLQLVFNVVAITGATSLASFCYQLRKENRKLASKLPGEIKQEDSGNPVVAAQAAYPASQQTSLTASTTTPADKDIRTFVAAQRTKWVDGMRLSATLWSARSK